MVPASKSAALLLAAAVLLSVTAACEFASPGQPSGSDATPVTLGHAPVFTPAHASAGAAIKAFLGSHPDPQQPFDFSHQIHLGKGAVCTDCHLGVESGPRAGLPSVNTCMICHSQIATDKPLIQQMTAMQSKGVDFQWQRVYDYPEQSHVRFNHAPHIRAKVECSTCHGNQAAQTVARRDGQHGHGVLRQLPQEQAGVERLPDLPLLIMDTPMARL